MGSGTKKTLNREIKTLKKVLSIFLSGFCKNFFRIFEKSTIPKQKYIRILLFCSYFSDLALSSLLTVKFSLIGIFQMFIFDKKIFFSIWLDYPDF
jgi:hypothetical protein